MKDREVEVSAEVFANEDASKGSGQEKHQNWIMNVLDILCKEITTVGCHSGG